MDSEQHKQSDSQRTDKRRASHTYAGTSSNQTAAGTEPDNKYYEVEEILDGPRKRREHLFKYCYKVRWKGYGPEADTWQPVADLANVQDMIEDYKKERAMKQREKGKKKPEEKCAGIRTRGRSSSHSQVVSSDGDDDDSDDDKQYDPVYGTVKDKFWKDLELGWTQNHAQLFSGDMYSKVKGCRRAAHADAVANIQRQQHLFSKTLHVSSELSPSTSKQSPKPIASGHLSASESQTSSSRSAQSSERSSPKHSPVSRVRKRPSDPFSARGYTSAKRSRRSKETKGGFASLENVRLEAAATNSASTSGMSQDDESITDTDTDLHSSSAQHGADMSQLDTVEDSTVEMSESTTTVAEVTEGAVTADEVTAAPERTDDDQNTVSSEVPLPNIPVSTGMDLAEEPRENEQQLADSGTPEKLDKAAFADLGGEPSTLTADSDNLGHSTSVNVGASEGSNETLSAPSCDDSGATSGGTLVGPSVIRKALSPKRSPLDAQSEASGAVERSHDEDCLWNGACNRSDCKSNRRRNMKNGRHNGLNSASDGVDQNTGNENSNTDDEYQNNHNCNTVDGNCGRNQSSSGNVDVIYSDNALQAGDCPSSSGLYRKTFADSLHVGPSPSSTLVCTSTQPSTSAQNDSSTCSQTQNLRHPSLLPPGKSNRSAPSLKPSVSSHYPPQGPACRSLFSSYHAESSDSSFDESPSGHVPLSREIVSDSFCHGDLLVHYHMQTPTGSNTCLAGGQPLSPTYGSLAGNIISQDFKEIRKSSMEVERPGLFSDNNSAFSFTRQDSGFSGGSGSATPGEQQGQFTLPSPTGSIHLCSPGKENFSSSNSKSTGITVSGLYNRLPVSGSVDMPSANSDLASHMQSLHSQPKVFSEPSENRAVRKRNSEASQPLEKIPSPNSRDADLDRQISSLSCDELEDFVEQGEERCSQKDMAFITNADLLQAVNLSKAEVVKHAIRQSQVTDHRLDFEQADSSGVTLLMRAVQRGTLAIVEMLLGHGVNVNAQQTNGTTSLMIAAEQNAVCLVALLLKYGANSSLHTVHTDRAETALMKAIKRQHQEVVSLMLRVGVNTAAPTCSSISALELAVERRNAHIERIVRFHCQQLEQAFQGRVLATLEETAELVEPLFPLQCFPLRESHQFIVKFISNIHSMVPGEGFLLFIAHTKITDKGVRCRFHGGCPIGSVTLNGITQTPLTKEVHFVTSCHPIVPGCNTLIIDKLADYTSKAKLIVQAFRARLLPC